MVSIYDVLKASKGIHVEDSFAEIWGRKLRGGYEIKTLTGVPPFTFIADGEPLIDWSMSGQTVQASTPTPSSPVAVEGVGTLSGSDFIIPVTCGGQTTNIYLGSVLSTRRIKKLVLTGKEDWSRAENKKCYYINAAKGCPVDYLKSNTITVICSHYAGQTNTSSGASYVNEGCVCYYTGNAYILYIGEITITTVTNFKTYLQQQYAAGTPVTIWYVLATPETAAVNEPLMKIGSYADELTKTGTGINIPTVNGSNTLTVGTTVQPSSMSITFRGK